MKQRDIDAAVTRARKKLEVSGIESMGLEARVETRHDPVNKTITARMIMDPRHPSDFLEVTFQSDVPLLRVRCGEGRLVVEPDCANQVTITRRIMP